MNGEALELYQSTGMELAMARSPQAVLEEAGRAAKALKDVVVNTKASIKLGESEHLKSEGWQTLGHFYGLTARITETRFVQYGSAQGWESVAELVHVASGKVISRAESMCMNDEDKWSARAKYEYVYVKKSGGYSIEDPGKDEIIWEDNPAKPGKKRPRKERTKIGEERVPQFQLKSMSQTRAISKVHSNVLKWVVVLAGYNPTPAEEVEETDDEFGGNEPASDAIQQPQRKSRSQQQPDRSNNDLVTDKEASDLWSIGYRAIPGVRQSLEKHQIESIVAAFGYKDLRQIRRIHYEAIKSAVEKGEAPTSDPPPES